MGKVIAAAAIIQIRNRFVFERASLANKPQESDDNLAG
jgi:hypothetical protein